MNARSLGKGLEWSELRQVLHEVPNRVFGDDALRHAVWPPALFVELRELDVFREPDRKVVVNSAALLEFSDPDIAEPHASSGTPLANELEAAG